MSPADMERLEAVGRSIISRMLHEPTLRLKQAADQERSYVFIQALRELMGLDPEELGTGAAGAEVSSLDERRQAAQSRNRSDS